MWPPSQGLTTQVVRRQEVNVQTYASVNVKAPASVVFDAVREVAEYGKWNSFSPDVTVLAQPDNASEPAKLNNGTLFTLHVVMDASKPDKKTVTQLKVTDISTPARPSSYVSKEILDQEPSYTADLSAVYRISWKVEGGFTRLGLKGERFHEVIMRGPNECEVRTWECQAGLLSHVVKWVYTQTLMDKFRLWVDDLKKFCEAKTEVV